MIGWKVCFVSFACLTHLSSALAAETVKTFSLCDLDQQQNDGLTIRTTGQVIDVEADELDPRFQILLLKNDAKRMPVLVERATHPDLVMFLDTTVSVSGLFQRASHGIRKFTGSVILGKKIEILQPPPSDCFDAPNLTRLDYINPEEINRLDKRSLRGTVLASWSERHLMVRSDDGQVVTVILAHDQALPECGNVIQIVGYPATDLFHINLTYARWKEAPAETVTHGNDPSRIDITDTKQLFYCTNGKKIIDSRRHGQLLRLTGTVRTNPPAEGHPLRFYIDVADCKLAIDVSTHPRAADKLKIGAEVEVTGRFLVEPSSTSSFNVFPQATNYAIIVNSANDLRVIRQPPWWTPARCLIAVSCLAAALIGFFLWNLSLGVLVRKRTRQAFRAEKAKARSELRIEDRTLLATELHDSLSQNLTGISMEIEAATRIGVRDPEKLMHHLGIADKALKSCRAELRNTLWDLRSQALDAIDMNEAINLALLPNLTGVRLLVRFNVSRARMSDSMTHDVLRMIRELSVNGILHGKANEIRVAGSVEDDRLLFSVTDNGSGFNPSTAPGVLQGHFGLKGLKDRANRLSGTITIKSIIGKGTKATVAIPIPKTDQEKT